MSGLDNSQIITDDVSLHAEEAGLTGRTEREHVSPLGTAPAGHLPEGEDGDGKKADPAAE
jgi:hypothetical protein